MKKAFKLNSNLPPLSLPLKGGEATSSINLPLSGGEQKRGLFKDHNSQSAFTLIELAIVVVVLGILVAGVVGGQSLIESAKRNAGISKIQQYKTAVNAFRLEFNATPGDMEDAYDYFGDECGIDSTSMVSGCNGDGDRCIGGINDQCPPVNAKAEGDLRRANVHLALSGIMPDMAYDINSRDGGCELGKTAEDIFGGVGVLFSESRNNKLSLHIISSGIGTAENGQCVYFSESIFTPKEAEKIDRKIDDGKARTGNARALMYLYDNGSYNNYCTFGNGGYRVDYPDQVCNLRVKID